MLKRGLKRKFPTEFSDPSVQDDYQRGLSDFQTAARKRESMRIRNTILIKPTDDHNDSLSGQSWEERCLTDKIALEQKVVDGSGKFLGACKSLQERLEAAKTLQLAKLRIDVLKYELNKVRRGRGSPPLASQQGKPSYGGVCLSDIRIPLVWRPVSKDSSGEEMKRSHNFAIFCIARIGSQIYDTSLVHPVDDRTCADVSFGDVVEFGRVAPHFELTLEIYAHALDGKAASSTSTDASLNTSDKEVSLKLTNAMLETPQKIARSISKAVGKKILSKELQPDQKGPRFEMVASVTLTLDECYDDVQTHDLYVCEPNSSTCPSLFGQVCCRMAAMPYCCEEEVLCGTVGVKRPNVTSSGKVQKMFCRLMDWKLSLWNDISHEEAARRPVIDIPVNRDTSILEKGSNSITLTNKLSEDQPTKTWELVFDESDHESQELKEKFLVHMFQHAADHRRWKRAAQIKMTLLPSKSCGGSVIKSTSSLGDETVPLYESIVTTKKRTVKNTVNLKRRETVKKAKSFKRTKSKLALIYNQTGGEDEDEENAHPNQVLIWKQFSPSLQTF